MREHPILFTGDMVRAILAGTKTQTRRPVKPQPAGEWAAPGKTACPYGQPGDRLWVREPGRVIHYRGTFSGPQEAKCEVRLRYLADAKETEFMALPSRLLRRLDFGLGELMPDAPMWARSCHGIPNGIFREAARIFLEIVSVRVERVRGISEAGAWAEGIEELDGMFDAATICAMAKSMGCPAEDARPNFACAWDSIYAAKGLGWDANPWVWVVEFKRVEGTHAAS